MSWRISHSLGPHDRDGYDSSGWLWEVHKDGDARRVLVDVTGTARAIGERGGPLPDDTRLAIATEGKSEVEKVLAFSEPPGVVVCGTMGCRPESLN